MTPARTAWAAAAGIMAAVAILLWAAMNRYPVGDDRLQQLVATTLLLGTPLALAGAVLARRLARSARGRDVPERLVGVATAGLRGPREEWGTAMRAELASVEDPHERRRFAIGCAVAALKAGIGPAPWLVAVGVGVVFAVGTLVASRISLAGDRAGILGYLFPGPMLALFAVTVATAFISRSFRTGLVTGVLALLSGLIGVLAMTMAEAARWYAVAGVYVLDGDAPKSGLALTRLDAILDPLAPQFLIAFLLFWTPWPVLGAAIGACLRKIRTGVGTTPG
jgi:hypothetical protein